MADDTFAPVLILKSMSILFTFIVVFQAGVVFITVDQFLFDLRIPRLLLNEFSFLEFSTGLFLLISPTFFFFALRTASQCPFLLQLLYSEYFAG